MKVQSVSWMDKVYEGAMNEDGDRSTEFAYNIIMETETGRRFELIGSTLTSEDYDFSTIKAIQEKRINKIENHLAAGGTLNMNRWGEIYPVYGSKTYQELDNLGYFKDLEKKDSGIHY